MKPSQAKLRAILLALSLGLSASLPAAKLKNGDPAPDFTLRSVDGKVVKLSDAKGKLVVLEWVNEGCPFVQKHYDSGNMQALQKKYTERGVVWLSLCSSAKGKQGWWETDAEAKAWRKAQGAAMTALLKDPDGAVGRAYGAKTTPHLYVIDQAGKLAYQGAIDDIPSTDPADVKTAKNWLAQALDELLAGKKVSVAQTRPYGCSIKYAR
jgi:peroxiredoxin